LKLSNERDLTHLTAERIQGFLDGVLPAVEVARVQRHVTSCSQCQADLESWRFLFSELGGLERLQPAAAFRDSVLAGLGTVADSQVEALLSGLGHYQPAPAFAARVMERWRHETAGQAALEAEIEGVFAGVGHFQPSPAFSRHIMAKVDVGALVRQARGKQPARVAVLVGNVAAFAGRLIPRTRHAWAVISGVAVTPVSVVALLAYAVFSNPLATPANLAQFAWWRVAGVISTLSESIPGLLLDSTATAQAYTAFEYVGSSPLTAAGGALSFALLTCGAVWVLYKNLISARAVDQSYARIAA
jgi:Putative zinc-finger